MKYKIEIRYEEYLEYKDWASFMHAIEVLFQGGKTHLEIEVENDD